MKSPIKDKPLRNPGQSLQERKDELFEEQFSPLLLFAIMLVVLAGLEWMREMKDTPPLPRTVSTITFAVVLYTIWKGRKILNEVRRLNKGIAGEKAVGQSLDRLREIGARIFHDIQGEGFNLDHVVIHTTGIYMLETKTWSKPDRGKAEIFYDGEQVLRNGSETPSNPVIQAKAGAKWLSEVLAESTGTKFPVIPVVLFPGWYITSNADAKRSVAWVLNPKALKPIIEKRYDALKPEEVSLCALHLKRFIQSCS